LRERDRFFEGEEELLGIGIDMEWVRHDRDALYSLVLEMCVDKYGDDFGRCVANGLCSNPVPLADEVASLRRKNRERNSQLEACGEGVTRQVASESVKLSEVE
jgi:hypothetical protein